MKSKFFKTISLLLIAVMLMSLASAAAFAEGTIKNRLVIQGLSDPGSYTLFDAGSSVRSQYQVCFYQTLFEELVPGELHPVLAESYERVGDGVYHITIRDGIHDSEGNPITIDDVVWCFQSAKDGGMRNSTYNNVVNIEKIDDRTFEIAFGEEFVGEFKYLMCMNGQPIVSRAAFEASEDRFASDPIGTGAYKLKSWNQGSSMILEKNENYWDEANKEAMQPYEEIEFRFISESTQIALALETGEVDVAWGVSNQDVAKFTEDKGFHQIAQIDPLTRALLFNCDPSNPFSDKRLRQAVCYAIDAEATITAVTEGIGEPCHCLIAAKDNSFFYDYNTDWNDQDYYGYNLEKAKELMAEAGYPDGGLKVRLMTKDTPEYNTTCQIMQAFLSQIGIEVEIMAYENALYQTYRYDPTAWDMNLCQVGGSVSVLQPWKWYCTPGAAGENRTIYMMDGSEFWPIYCEGAHESTHSPETVEAAWQWMKEEVPMYGYGFNYKFVIYNDKVYTPTLAVGGWHFPWLDGQNG